LSLAAGAWMAGRWLSVLTQSFRGAARARAAIVLYATLLVFWGWRPLYPQTRWDVIAAQLNVAAFVPLASLAGRMDVFSALHVAQQFFLYVPLGALLAVWPLRRHGGWARLWPGVWLAIVIELGHIVVAGRTFDATNALLACAGLAMGWVAVRRCGYAPYGTALDRVTAR
ncbi:MAG: VanZ family protein, partial [Gemmatimonadaceae bacterium]